MGKKQSTPDESEDLESMKRQIKAQMKAELKDKIRRDLKQEVLEEIYQELKSEEFNSLVDEIQVNKQHKPSQKEIEKIESRAVKKVKSDFTIQISIKSILKLASHALKYANKSVPRDKWVEVIGILAGKYDEKQNILSLEDVYPMGHGNAIHAEIKDYKNFVVAFNDLRKQGYFIAGWYHSHPTYGLFMSGEDVGTQSRYQRLWKNSVALVVDPYMIDGKTFGFKIFQANLKTNKWFELPFKVKGALTAKELPELLDFINPLVDGKALYLEYDE